MSTIDVSTIVGLSLGSLALSLLLYAWTALALSAVFGKSGEASGKAWVPILNLVVLLELGGQSGWLLLLLLAPGVGALILWVFLVIAAYRINVAFGHGTGMTVLAALSLPIWATVLGFGSARWLGTGIRPARENAAPRVGRPANRQPSRSPGADPFAPRALGEAPLGEGPASGAAPSLAAGPAYGAARVAAASEHRPAPARTSGESWSSSAAPAAPASASLAARVPMPPMPSMPPPSPPLPAAANRRSYADDGFDLGAVGELTSDVTAAVPGAPAPVSAAPVSAAPFSAAPLSAVAHAWAAGNLSTESAPDFGPAIAPAPVAAEPEPDSAVTAVPPVTRAPVSSAARPRAAEEPWAPPQWSPEAADDGRAPYESSAEVSAIVSAPEAGSPRSARASVSAQHLHPEIPDDAFDETVVTRRRRPIWTLVPPAGAAVPIGSEIVIVGRKPAPDAAFPAAQLVSVDDGTVSKTHARLELRNERWFITDLGSTNGVLFATLMGTEVEAPPGVEVEAGDRFFLGDAEVRLQRSDG